MSPPSYSRGRWALIVVALGSVAGFAVLHAPALAGLRRLLDDRQSGAGWAALGLAALVHLVGHVLRAARTKVVVDNVRRGSLAGQFRHLTIGYLFNAVWPGRPGEFIRAWLIAKTLRISFLYTLLAVLLERLIDVVLVSVACLALVLLLDVPVTGFVPFAAAVVLVVSGLLLVSFAALVRENEHLLRLAFRATGCLNTKLENRARFKVWSVIFGFQSFVRQRRQLLRYGVLTLASWACYAAAAGIVAVTVFPALSARDGLAAAAAPYGVVSLGLGNSRPDGFAEAVRVAVVESSTLDGADVLLFAAIMWAVFTIPVVAVALVAVFVNWAGWSRAPVARTDRARADGYVNKLGRDRDISDSMTHFLDAYFQRDRLTQVMHRLEVTGTASLVRLFKGGSNAVTLLATSGSGGLFVKKMVPPEHAHRLQNQHDWLAARADHPELVSVLREHRAPDHYAIDLEYRPSTVPLVEYLHERPFSAGAARLDEVWRYMYDRVYRVRPAEVRPELVDEYVMERLVLRVQAAARSHSALEEALKADRVVVNGRELDGFDRVLTRIRSTGQAWDDLVAFQPSDTIHGDLTVDNVLVDLATGRILVIDPSDDNQVRGPVIDFARQLQSLLYGYEFLNEDDDPVVLGARDDLPEITYRDVRSARYAELAEYVTSQVMPRHLTVSEQRAVLFHVGLFYGRMLTHRVAINPGTVLKYFGVSLLALNRFLEQYELPVVHRAGDRAASPDDERVLLR